MLSEDIKFENEKSRIYKHFLALEFEGLAKIEWSPDVEPDLSWADDITLNNINSGDYECLVLTLSIKNDKDEWEVVDSLCGIILPTTDRHDYDRICYQKDMVFENENRLINIDLIGK